MTTAKDFDRIVALQDKLAASEARAERLRVLVGEYREDSVEQTFRAARYAAALDQVVSMDKMAKGNPVAGAMSEVAAEALAEQSIGEELKAAGPG